MAKANQQKFKLEITEQHQETIIGFNNSAAPLKDRSDLSLLMDIALNSGDTYIASMFKTMPTEEQWAQFKADEFTAQTSSGDDSPE